MNDGRQLLLRALLHHRITPQKHKSLLRGKNVPWKLFDQHLPGTSYHHSLQKVKVTLLG
jgi:hypothetical protein